MAAAVAHGQIVAFVAVPIDTERLSSALANAYDEANARLALLGGPPRQARVAAPPPAAPDRAGRRLRRWRWRVAAAIAAVVYFWHSGTSTPPVPPPRPGAAPAGGGRRPRAAAIDAATEEKVDGLIEQAQRAMRDRHFIDPAEGSALSLYRAPWCSIR